MSRDGFDPGLQFVTLEGGSRGEVYHLAARRVSLGRQDPLYASEGQGRISFPEPTVSGIHATLEWDDKKQRYLFTHHSKTNHSLIDGRVVSQPQFLHVGNKLKMGALVLQLRLAPSRSVVDMAPTTPGLAGFGVSLKKASETPPGFTILVLNGPDAATLYPVNQESYLVQEPNSMATTDPVIGVRGLGNCRAQLQQKGKEVHVTCHDQGQRPTLIDNPLAGVIRQRLIGPELGTKFIPDSILLCNGIALIILDNQDAVRSREMLLSGEVVNRFQAGLFHEGNRMWNRGEQHLLRCVSGPLKGVLLWIDPRNYEDAIRIGKIGTDSLLELTDRGAANVEFYFDDDGFVVHNADKDLAVGLNHTDLGPDLSQHLASGDIVRVGRTAVRYEFLPIQSRINTYAVVCEGVEYPLVREVNIIGSEPQADIQFKDTRLGHHFGQIVVGETSLKYQHKNSSYKSNVMGKTIHAGEEVGLRVDTLIELLPGLAFRIVRRSSDIEEPL